MSVACSVHGRALGSGWRRSRPLVVTDTQNSPIRLSASSPPGTIALRSKVASYFSTVESSKGMKRLMPASRMMMNCCTSFSCACWHRSRSARSVSNFASRARIRDPFPTKERRFSSCSICAPQLSSETLRRVAACWRASTSATCTPSGTTCPDDMNASTSAGTSSIGSACRRALFAGAFAPSPFATGCGASCRSAPLCSPSKCICSRSHSSRFWEARSCC